MPDPILIQYGKYYNIPIHLYYIEADSDASNIPADAPIGSMAYVNESGNFHVLMKDSSSNWNTISASGSSLPSVTSSDNGKVLAVENGAWAAQNDFVVTLSIDPDTFPDQLNADKSSAEIQTAYLQGKRLVFALPAAEDEVYYAFPELRYTIEAEEGTRYSFGAILSADSFGTYYVLTDANLDVEYVTGFTLIPAS